MGSDAFTLPSSWKTEKLARRLLQYAKLVSLFKIPPPLIFLTSLIGPM